MSRSSFRATLEPARVASWVVSGGAALAGAWACYGFGEQLGGVFGGVVAALNGAALCSIVTSSVLARWVRRPSRD